MPTQQELQMLQALPLKAKILKTQARIREWVNHYGIEGVYVSFSGGKDSTVLLDIVRNRCGYKDIPAVYFDTGLEYPEIKEFVKSFDNVTIIRPDMTFRQVIEKFGYPIFTKDLSDCVYQTRLFIKKNPNCTDESQYPQRYLKMLGKLKHKEKGVDTDEYSKMYNYSNYKYLLDADFLISSKCCDVMKKKPAHDYMKKTGRKPLTAQMASESRQRTRYYLKNGCNGFDMKQPISNPMGFWTENDVLQYIYENGIQIASVYGDVVVKNECDQYALFEMDCKEYCTTGCERTGCMFCLYGIQQEHSPNRLEQMKETHPSIYEYVMRSEESGGLGYKEKIDWLNEHGNLGIRY